jgi:hypothetical protein
MEKSLRVRAGETAYGGDFVEHYVLPVLYPGGLTRGVQLALGGVVVLANLALYAVVVRRRRRSRGA